MTSAWTEEAKAVDTANPTPAEDPASAKVRPKKARRARLVFVVLGTGAVAAAVAVRLWGGGTESTDDAQVEGHIINVSARVPGQVVNLLVHDNQLVNKGDVLLELDDSDYQAKLVVARADVASAEAGVTAARAQLALVERMADASVKQASGGVVQAAAGWVSTRAAQEHSKAEIAAAESKLTLTQSELERAATLRKHDVISQADYDARLTAFQQADAQRTQARSRLSAADASATATSGAVETAEGRLAQAKTVDEQIAVARAAVGVAEARVVQARAALRLAELNVSYTRILSPAQGTVSRRTVEPGQMVSPERSLLALVSPDDTWIVANFKEDQLASISIGQSARVKVDAYGDLTLAGHVESIAGASGSRFSLLPPDNASGNFIKVVQRIPVVIRLDTPQAAPLRPGMSAEVTVATKTNHPSAAPSPEKGR